MKKTQPAHFVLLVLVFSAVFLALISTLSGFIFVQKKVQLAEVNKQKAQNLAEAGLEYYRWHLAHYPDDLQDGTGTAGPYVHTIDDPEGGVVGTFSLEIGGTTACNELTDVTITSTGASQDDPTYKRTLVARYAKPNVANFSTVTNSNVWVGSDRVISGPYHSNGGIRMDGTHNATVSSALSTWSCTSSFGCSPTSNQNGVFGGGGPSALWEFPAPQVDFNGITIDLSELKTYAVNSGGVYIAPSAAYGYRVTFNADGTFDLRKVTGTTQVWGYSLENGWLQERTVISSTQAPINYAIDAECPVIFVEDDVWVDGTLSGKAVLASADLITAGAERSVILNGDLTYANGSANGDGLTVIGERNVLVGLEVPDVMDIHGVFIAQNGKFGRNHYCQNDCTGTGGSGDSGSRTGATAESAVGWSNFTVSRLNSSNNSRASCDATCDNNDNGQLSDFSFNVPSGATITGIEVTAEMSEGASAGSIGTQVSLSWDDGANFTSTKSATVNGTSDTDYTFGGSSDTWGRTWSDTDFANGNFRLLLDKVPDSDVLNVDYVRVRVYYTTGSGLPSSLDAYVLRSTLNTNGTVVSNGRVGTKWTSGGTFVSGYSQRNDNFDRNLAGSPPPFTPVTSDDYQFIIWQDQNVPF